MTMLFLFSIVIATVLVRRSDIVSKSNSSFPDGDDAAMFSSSGTKHMTCCSRHVMRVGISDISTFNAAIIGLLGFRTFTLTCKYATMSNEWNNLIKYVKFITVSDPDRTLTVLHASGSSIIFGVTSNSILSVSP